MNSKQSRSNRLIPRHNPTVLEFYRNPRMHRRKDFLRNHNPIHRRNNPLTIPRCKYPP